MNWVIILCTYDKKSHTTYSKNIQLVKAVHKRRISVFTHEHKTVDRPDICCDMLQYVGTFYRVLLRYIAIKRVLILLNNGDIFW